MWHAEGRPAAAIDLLVLTVLPAAAAARHSAVVAAEGLLPSWEAALKLVEADQAPSQRASKAPAGTGLPLHGSALVAEQWLAGCDYEAPVGAADKLGFQEGDVLTVLDKDTGGWWFARLGGQEGWVPSDFLDPFVDEEAAPITPASDEDALMRSALAFLAEMEAGVATEAGEPSAKGTGAGRISSRAAPEEDSSSSGEEEEEEGPPLPPRPTSRDASAMVSAGAPMPEPDLAESYEDMSDCFSPDRTSSVPYEVMTLRDG